MSSLRVFASLRFGDRAFTSRRGRPSEGGSRAPFLVDNAKAGGGTCRTTRRI